MKAFLILVFLLFSITLIGQNNKTVIDERSGKPMLIGVCDRNAFSDSNYSWWFTAEYDNYEPDSLITNQLNLLINDYKIIIVMATWCGDSRREIPRLFKILDKTSYDCKKLEIVNVDRNKKSIEGGIENLDIKLVPTIIVLTQQKELGRIIESPKGKLEVDLLEIISKK